MIYVETSALIKVLFREVEYEPVATYIEQGGSCCTSTLTFIETYRAVRRAVSLRELKESTARELMKVTEQTRKAWSVLQITPAVQRRAEQQFEIEPIRALDAIHLATALEFRSLVDELVILSFDEQLKANIEPLGLESAKI